MINTIAFLIFLIITIPPFKSYTPERSISILSLRAGGTRYDSEAAVEDFILLGDFSDIEMFFDKPFSIVRHSLPKFFVPG